MQHVLARHAAMDAARAKTAALGALVATSCGTGAKGAHHEFNSFIADMDRVIAAASPAPETPTLEQAEIIAFERIARRAQ